MKSTPLEKLLLGLLIALILATIALPFIPDYLVVLN